jgi:hypothetical protein
MATQNELWFAARQTEIVYMPRKLLETFGETAVNYTLLSPLGNDRFRARTGIVKAERPRIVTPHYWASQALENFGEEARRYFEDILSRKDGAAIIQYGLQFSKEAHSEETASGSLKDTAEMLAKQAQDSLQEVRGVLVGHEKYWEISLVFFLQALVSQSVPVNVREMAGRGLFNVRNGIPFAIRQELELDFQNATTREAADALGDKLRDYGVFEEYEDQFFNLYAQFR